MPNSASHSERLQALFSKAVEMPAEQCAAFLDAQCRDEPALRREVEALLECDSNQPPGFLDVAAPAVATGQLGAGDLVAGRYTLIRILGEGGMGVVHLARQDHPSRTVALKLIRPGLASRHLLRRFEVEAQLLGRLNHPGIAQIYDAGTLDDEGQGGRPFFAMEFVDGLPLLQFLARHQLALRERLGLFVSICDAVQHAHQKGVVHRDLKPANILVDQAGRPKVLDFGVARAMDRDLQVTTLQTGVGQIIGTLQYMSPEQVEGDAQAVDTRSDVYALGVLLYQMLAGRPPYELSDRSIAAAARVISETSPAPLTAVDRTLRGDLNTIVLKSLEKDPDLRYQSASDLAADVRRYLKDEPVIARPASTMYQLRKFARRNRALVASVVAVFFVLVAGIIVSGLSMLEAQRERDEATRQTRIAEAVNDFLNNDLLGRANPYIGAAHDATLREVLDQAAASIENRLLDDPVVNARLRATLGSTYFQLGEYDRAERLLVPAIEIFRDELGDGAPLTNQQRHTLALAHLFSWWQGPETDGLESAEAVLQAFLGAVEKSLGPRAPLAAKAHADFAILRRYQGRPADAEKEYRQALAIYAANDDVNPREVAVTKENFGLLLYGQERYADAEPLMTDAVEMYKASSGDDSADVAFALTNLGHLYWQSRGDAGLDLARSCFERACDIRLRRLGDHHPETLRSQYSLALILDAQGEYEQAERLHRDVLRRRLEILDDDHIDVLWSLNDLAETLEHQKRYDEAMELNRTVLARGEARYGPLRSVVPVARGDLLRVIRLVHDDDALHEVHVDYVNALEHAAEAPDAGADVLRALARELLECEVVSLRDPAQAFVAAQRAVDGDPAAASLSMLADALAANGRLDDAVTMQRRAIDALPADTPEKTRAAYRASLDDLLRRLSSPSASDSPQ